MFWCLGGNSINTDIKPAEIYAEIVNRVEYLKSIGVKKVYVSEISERGDFRKTPGLTKETFDEKRLVINRRLRRKFKDDFVTFPGIKYSKDYDDDKVHFGDGGDKKGLKKYFIAVRGILLSYKTNSWSVIEQFT